VLVVPALAYEDKDATNLREYTYIARRFVGLLEPRVSSLEAVALGPRPSPT
jgi:hypothetical protein